MDIIVRAGSMERLILAVSPDVAMINKLGKPNQSLARKVALVAAAILLFIPSTIMRIAISPVLLAMWIFQLANPKKPPYNPLTVIDAPTRHVFFTTP